MVKPGRPLERWTSTETDWPRAPVRVAEETQASMPRNGRPVGGNYAGTCALDRLPAGTGMEIPSLSVTPSGTPCLDRKTWDRGVPSSRTSLGSSHHPTAPTRSVGDVIVTADIIEHCKHAGRPPERVPVENMHQLQYAALVPLHAGTVGHTGTSGLPAGTQAAARYGRT